MFDIFIKKIKSQYFVFGIFIILILIIIDQVIKQTIVNHDIFYTCNYGIAFGIRLPIYLLTIFWIGIMAYIFYLWWQKRKENILQQLPFLLIIAGGLSNIIDRILYGCIVDYIPFLNISVFNFADVLITSGVVLIIFNQSVKG